MVVSYMVDGIYDSQILIRISSSTSASVVYEILAQNFYLDALLTDWFQFNLFLD